MGYETNFRRRSEELRNQGYSEAYVKLDELKEGCGCWLLILAMLPLSIIAMAIEFIKILILSIKSINKKTNNEERLSKIKEKRSENSIK